MRGAGWGAAPAIPTEMPMRLIGLAVVLAVSLTLAPLAAEGQPAANVPRIGYLALAATAPPGLLVERLREAGYVDGQNVRIDYRFGEGKHDAMGAPARELAANNSARSVSERLREPGYFEAGNIRIELDSPLERPERLDKLAADLAHLRVDIVVATLVGLIAGARESL